MPPKPIRDHIIQALPALLAHALVLAHDGATARSAIELEHLAKTVAPTTGPQWLDADVNLRWATVSLDLGDRESARAHAEIARAALRDYPDPGVLSVRLTELAGRIAGAQDLELTSAELRVLAFLPTHLSLKEIAERLHLSRATVKTHVSSIYGKLDVSTRSEAVEKMDRLGLRSPEPARTNGAELRQP